MIPLRVRTRETARVVCPSPFTIRPYTCFPHLTTLRDHDVRRNFEDSFLETAELLTPSRNAKIIREFCYTGLHTPASQERPKIKIEDREYATNRRREHPKEVTVDQLHNLLQEERFNVPNQPNADLRQIWVQNITPEVFWTLARTTHEHQVKPLQDAVAKHISGETSIRVYQHAKGFNTPQIQLHLPYLTLRDQPDRGSSPGSHDDWPSFLFSGQNANGATQADRLVIREAHISIVLSVWDESKWVAFAFSRPGGALGGDDNEDKGKDETKEPETDTVEEPEPNTDIFTPDDMISSPLTDHSIQDPREYFLHVIEPWVYLIREESDYLVRTVTKMIKHWLDFNRGTLAGSDLLEDALKAARLLRKIQGYLVPIISEWQDFIQPDGDITYFNLVMDQRTKISLTNTKSHLQDLIKLERILETLAKDCDHFINELEFRSRYQSELRTDKLNRDGQKMIQRGTESAENTSRMTRTNGALIGLTNPLLLALQYFSAQKPIFPSIDQSPRNFVIAILVLGLMTAVLMYGIGYLDIIWSFIMARLPRKGECVVRSRAVFDSSSEPQTDPDAIGMV
ncbi:hypothetical protein T440DRAFT_542477 [Plenodomus tracheiphilus IPT5]|uniref:Uncharacterized protein n=1 Tax=Plenodomus tracheiphilus IPT5 TaxID=1408161 RepID=A0A6A7BHL1_9PLEO|nr:hypothetical protein T440DRAFT_542477 [Plenodomus tracheiphilus IPT5]